MPTAPTLIAGRYRLGEPLGAGGMGRVWQAGDEILGREVAIKEIVLPDELIGKDREAVRKRTLREARAVARLNHPGVVQVYDVLEADGRTFIVMEYVPSRSLQELLRADGPLDPQDAAQVGLAVLAALSAAHRAGVLHRDVKPANVLLAHDGRVVLSDFGIAIVEGDSHTTSSGVMLGSPEYMAPEQVRHGTAGVASDLWSLGATLYAAVEGRSPYHRRSVMETVTALAVDEPDPPRQAGALRPVLDGLLRTDPAERIDAAETERLLATVAETPPRSAEPAGRPAPAGGDIPRQRSAEPGERITPAPEAAAAAAPAIEQPATEPPAARPPEAR
ncbi:MAG TPA: serine/threonine-protein kinase, partial [Actinoplanes sp.]|nr:serine/threonine-protein kinase [Actinoplanes sp.]